MSDYTAVAPPTNLSGACDPNSAFADALQRARQIAAKINTPVTESGAGIKRPLEEATDPQTKKIAAVNDPFGAQLAAMQQQQRLSAVGMAARMAGPPSNAVTTEEVTVPDKMVGLIIGKGGEQITRLQSESQCKIQLAQDSGGNPDRSCTLTGSRASIEKAKELIGQIISRGGPPSVVMDAIADGLSTIEIMIPAPKVGLIIGKGGETIKNLQERTGVKMVMIQDGSLANAPEKPLRLTGDPQKCDFARQLVLDLLTEKELEGMNRMGGRGDFRRNPQNNYGGEGSLTEEVLVPRTAVGVVIGKGGEMIKTIQNESGARVQFQPEDGPGDRACHLSGSAEQIEKAKDIVHNLINSIMARDQQNVGRGRGRGRGFDDRRGGGREFGGPPGNGHPGRGPPGPDKHEVQFSVPANKCGLVIGKGGETIRGINQQSGAHVELSRNPPPNPDEKVFVIRGNPQQIDHAQHLINEKVGMGPGPGGFGGQMPGGNTPQDQIYMQPNQQGPPQNQSFAPQGWNGAFQQWNGQPSPSPANPNKPEADPNAAAWAAYQGNGYSQPQPTSIGQPHQAPQPASVAAPATNGAQQDYSAAWADYYRSMGMFREAELIEQQARASQAAVGSQPPVTVGQYTQPAVAAAPQPAMAPSIPSAGGAAQVPSSAPVGGPGPGPNPGAPTVQVAPGQPFPGYGQYYGQNYSYGYSYQRQQ